MSETKVKQAEVSGLRSRPEGKDEEGEEKTERLTKHLAFQPNFQSNLSLARSARLAFFLPTPTMIHPPNPPHTHSTLAAKVQTIEDEIKTTGPTTKGSRSFFFA